MLLECVEIPLEGKLVKLAPLTAGRVAGNLASGIVPESSSDALSVVREASYEPLKVVADAVPVIVTPVLVVSNFLLLS